MTDSFYASHGQLTDPGCHGPSLDALPRDPAAICRIVQGLLIHDHFGRFLYGTPPSGFELADRETLPVSRRLDAIFETSSAAITRPRPPFERSVGTCRDFALMLCAVLRQQGRPARVRCGFARYLGASCYEDHWVCEYWSDDKQAWAIADAQLDGAHRRHFAIDFEATDVPGDQFVLPWRAWQMVRSEAVDPAFFRHGSYSGVWLVRVNLARDLLSLAKREISLWDSWREAREESRALDAEATALCDEIARLTEAASDFARPESAATRLEGLVAKPPWRR